MPGNIYPHTDVVHLAHSAAQVQLTATTSETILGAVSIPAGLLGLNSVIEWDVQVSYTNNANAKTLRALWNAGSTVATLAVTTETPTRFSGSIRCRNSLVAQLCAAEYAKSGGAGALAHVSSGASVLLVQAFSISAQLANAGDSLTLESFWVRIYR